MEIQYDLHWQELVLVPNYSNGNDWFDFEMYEKEKFIKYQQLFMDFSQNTMNKYLHSCQISDKESC